MKTKSILVLFTAILIIGCGSNSNNSDLVITSSQQQHRDPQNLGEQGIIGKWKCTVTGYVSIITINQDDDQYTSFIEFEKENMESKSESLIMEGDKYMVSGSTAKEYYVINDDGNLELWDSDGLWTTAASITPGRETTVPKFSVRKSIGENVFSIANTYSKSSPKTLEGTNNQNWIVYYEDLNVTFKVSKKTDFIQSAKSGKHPNL